MVPSNSPQALEELCVFDDDLERVQAVLKHPMLFVCGPPKSGTTWLQFLLDGHPEIQCGGEGHFGDWLAAPINQVLADYDQRRHQVNDFIYQERASYTVPLRKQDGRFLTRMAIGLVLSRQGIEPGIKWLGDKTPLYIQWLEIMRTLMPTARFIAIIRDPRDACVSVLNQADRMRTKGLGNADGLSEADVLTRFLNSWQRSISKMQEFRRQYPNSLHHLRYEDLSDKPTETLGNAFDFLEVDKTEDIINTCLTKADFTALSGGRKRGQEDPNSFFRKGVVGDWATTLKPEHLGLIEEIVGEQMVDFGYNP